MPPPDTKNGPLRLEKFTGLDNLNLPVDVGFGGLVEAVNFAADRNGHFTTRPGRTKVFEDATGIAFHSDGQQCLFLAGGHLRRINANRTVDDLGPLPGKRIVFKTVAGKAMIHTDRAQAVLSGNALRPMGIPMPSGLEIIIQAGALKAGQYLVTATEVAEDGRESGALPVRAVDVQDGDGFIVVPTVTPGRQARVYLSERDGKALFHYADGNWVGVGSMADTLNLNSPCLRQYLGAFPTADYMEWFAGYLWVAAGDRLFRSPALDYEFCDWAATDAIAGRKVGPITLLISVDTGMYLSDSTQLYWIPAAEPDTMLNVWTHNEPAIPGPGNARILNMGKVGQGASGGKGCLFLTASGFALGDQQGQVTLLTRRKLSFPDVSQATTTQYQDRFIVCCQ